MPAHIVRLLLLLAGLMILAVSARNYVIDPSYGQFGSYRGDAIAELMAGAPQFRGPAYCQACHTDRHTEWTVGAHVNVKCEACHGPAGEHPVGGALAKPDDAIKLCTLCHEAMPTRPAAQPQIVVAEHPFKHDQELQCVACHNPHSPKIGGQPASDVVQTAVTPTAETPASPTLSARLVALTAPCTPCHGADGRGVGTYPTLVGSERAELVSKLEAYRSGAQQEPMMNAIAGSLNDEVIAELAKHYAGLPAEPR